MQGLVHVPDEMKDPAERHGAIPRSRAAYNVQIGLMFPGTDARLVPGGFAGELGQAMAWVRRADAQGRFVVPGGEKIQTVVVAAPNGYAETTLDELRKVRAVRGVDSFPVARVCGLVIQSLQRNAVEARDSRRLGREGSHFEAADSGRTSFSRND